MRIFRELFTKVVLCEVKNLRVFTYLWTHKSVAVDVLEVKVYRLCFIEATLKRTRASRRVVCSEFGPRTQK